MNNLEQHIKPFSEIECKTHIMVGVKPIKLAKKHERALEILEGIIKRKHIGFCWYISKVKN